MRRRLLKVVGPIIAFPAVIVGAFGAYYYFNEIKPKNEIDITVVYSPEELCPKMHPMYVAIDNESIRDIFMTSFGIKVLRKGYSNDLARWDSRYYSTDRFIPSGESHSICLNFPALKNKITSEHDRKKLYYVIYNKAFLFDNHDRKAINAFLMRNDLESASPITVKSAELPKIETQSLSAPPEVIVAQSDTSSNTTSTITPMDENNLVITNKKINASTSKENITFTTKTNSSPEVKSTQTNYSDDEKWIMDQPGENYTIQLIATTKKDSIQRYIEENNLSDSIAYYEKTSNGRVWYTLIQGSFKTYIDAKKARERLAPALKKTKPWIKHFKGIKESLSAS